MLITPAGAIQDHPSLLPGFAEPEATVRIAKKHADWSAAYRKLGRTGLACSGVGFGSYRVHLQVQEHRAALARALRMGVNLIDTSSNYAGGNSERLIGEVVAGLIGQGTIAREEIILVTKGGYIQGELFEEMLRRANTAHADHSPGSELTELVRHSQGLWHSIHPDFLRDQIDDSLERLQVQTIDVYLLHNPEYYLEWALGEEIPADEAREEYHRRIKQAFAYLETEVARGRIRWYGISSNTFPKPEDAPERTSLEHIWQFAEEVGGNDHHFGVIEFPMNLFEPGAIAERNQRRGTETVLEYCEEKNLGVLINRPLNALAGKQLIRLADVPERDVPPEQDLDDLLHDLKLQEEHFISRQLPELELDEQSNTALQQFLTLGRNLHDGNWKEFSSMEEWQEISHNILAPRIQYAFNILQAVPERSPALMTFLTTYAETVDEMFEHITNYYTNRGHARGMKIHQALDVLIGKEYSDLSLSQKALLLLRSLPQVSSVLVGMRTEEYVDDVIYGLQAQFVPHVEEVWKKLAIVKAEA
jgi:hypothetical protein